MADLITVSFSDETNIADRVAAAGVLWVVSDEADATAIEAWSVPAATLGTRDGGDITTWTPTWKTGDWTPLEKNLKGTLVWIALPAWQAQDDKGKKMLKALAGALSARGAKVLALDLPAGESIADVLAGGDSPESVAQRLAQSASMSLTAASTQAEGLFNIAVNRFNFHVTEDHTAFIVLKDGPQYAWPLRGGGTLDVAKYLTNEYRRITGTVVPRKEVGDCLAAMEAACASAPVSVKLSLRSARSASTGNYWIDLGGPNGNVIKLTPEGWSVEQRPDPDVFFRRTNVIKELPFPERIDETVARTRLHDLLKRFVNVAEADWPLLVAWMVTHLVPGFQPPICLLVSEADAGKSTATMAVRFAVEGQLTKGAQMSAKQDDIAVTMAGERLTVFNNVSKISGDQSDFLCQVVDGTEYSKRKLHTDADIARLEISPSVLMNGITTGQLKGDFKTRAIRLELKSLYGERLSDDEVKQALIESHPEVFGCLLEIAVGILRTIPTTTVHDPQPRMIDYARVLVALNEMWSLGGSPITRFRMSLDEMSLEAMDDLLFKTVHHIVVQPQFWQGNAWVCDVAVSSLCESMNAAKVDQNIKFMSQEKKGMFDTSEKMAAALRKAKPDWERLGVSFDNLGQSSRAGHRQTWYRFTFKDLGDDTPWSRGTFIASVADLA